MSKETLYLISYIWLGVAIAVHITMFFITAPFGRHTSDKWGKTINNKLGWFIMESPSLLIMVYFLFNSDKTFNSYIWVLFLLWIMHYANRSFIYPLRIKATPKQIPVFIVMNAILFNFMNAGLNGYYLSNFANTEDYNSDWFYSTHFILGFTLFCIGAFINLKSDSILINLRKPGEIGYKIPKGFLFDYISSPNLFGELIEWSGFALMAWNLPALTFMIWTFANLVPRAKNHHDWYKKQFPDYPAERKVIFPFLF